MPRTWLEPHTHPPTHPPTYPLPIGEDTEDADDWNLAGAAAVCLELIANTVQDKIIELIIPFVSQNIQNADWHFKEAATMAFGMVSGWVGACVRARVLFRLRTDHTNTHRATSFLTTHSRTHGHPNPRSWRVLRTKPP